MAETSKTVSTFISNHAPELLTAIIVVVSIDNIRARIGLKKEQKVFDENMIKQQQVIRKHETEINVLKDEAEQAQETMQKIDRLAQIVTSMTEGGASEWVSSSTAELRNR